MESVVDMRGEMVEVINIVAIVLSPAIAVAISIFVQDRKQKRFERLSVFNTLMATRHEPIADENVRALNMIDVVFDNCKDVRRLWREYYEMLCNNGLDNEQGYQTRQKKNLELIHEIGRSLGYGRAISHLDVDRVYYPKGLGEQSRVAHEIANELLRVLKATEGLAVRPAKKLDCTKNSRS